MLRPKSSCVLWSASGVCGLLAVAAIAFAQHEGALPAAGQKSLSELTPAAGKAVQRQREGSLLTAEIGAFELVGDRVVFVPAGSRESFRVLENLALERVLRELGDARDQRNWSVWGQFTEFRGANYLLVTKALVKTAPGPAASRREQSAATNPVERNDGGR
ncbi:MAG TPA: hypothetical protein VFV87_12745 [Pirellulaceae bacterium]|nr:hypothetical protein [Pirellulaceae bacterium]